MAFGKTLLHFEALESTSDYARSLAQDERNHGSVVIADFQTRGRGQYGRVWQAPPKSSLLFSLVLFPPPRIYQPTVLTALAAVGVTETIAPFVSESRIKWPNDVLVSRKKISGILIEAQPQPVPCAIVGIGLNLNQTQEDFHRLELPDATSLHLETGQRFDHLEVASQLVSRIESHYESLLRDDFAPLENHWRNQLGLLGKSVRLRCTPEREFQGVIRELSFTRIVVERASGEMETHPPEWIRGISLAEENHS